MVGIREDQVARWLGYELSNIQTKIPNSNKTKVLIYLRPCHARLSFSPVCKCFISLPGPTKQFVQYFTWCFYIHFNSFSWSTISASNFLILQQFDNFTNLLFRWFCMLTIQLHFCRLVVWFFKNLSIQNLLKVLNPCVHFIFHVQPTWFIIFISAMFLVALWKSLRFPFAASSDWPSKYCLICPYLLSNFFIR